MRRVLSFYVVLDVLINLDLMAFRVRQRSRKITKMGNHSRSQGGETIGDNADKECASVSFKGQKPGLLNTPSARCLHMNAKCVVGLWPRQSDGLNHHRDHGPGCCYNRDNREGSECYNNFLSWYGEVRLECEKEDENDFTGVCKEYMGPVGGKYMTELQTFLDLDEQLREKSLLFESAMTKWETGHQGDKDEACAIVERVNKEIATIMGPLTSIDPKRPIVQMFNNMKATLGLVQTDGGRATELANTAIEGIPGHGGMMLTGAYAITRGILNMYSAAMKAKQQRRIAITGGLVYHYCDLMACLKGAAFEVSVKIMCPLTGENIGTIGCNACEAFDLNANGPFMSQLQHFFEGPLSSPIANLMQVCAVIAPIQPVDTPSFHPHRLGKVDCFEDTHAYITPAMGLLQETIEVIKSELAGNLNPTVEEASLVAEREAVSTKIDYFGTAAAKAEEATREDVTPNCRA